MKRQTLRIILSLVTLVSLSAAPAAAQVSDATAKRIVSDAVRAAGGGDALAGNPAKIAATLRLIAADLNAIDQRPDHFGVLVKTSGSHCSGLSCDIICSGDGQGQQQWDVLIAAGDPGGSRPTWDHLDTIAVRPCIIVPAETAPTPDSPDGDTATHDDLADDHIELLKTLITFRDQVTARLAAIEARVETAAAAATSAAQLAADIKGIVSVGTGVPAALPPYKGSWGFITIISRPCPECGR